MLVYHLYVFNLVLGIVEILCSLVEEVSVIIVLIEIVCLLMELIAKLNILVEASSG